MREITREDVQIEIKAAQDDIPVRGNALASGDDEQDREAEDEINRRLDNGDVWAWACVTVRGTFCGLTATDTLGACSYRDESDFREPGGYFDDMVAAVVDELNERIDCINKTLDDTNEAQQ